MSRLEKWKANKWFYLAVLFLLVNAYGVFRMARPQPNTSRPVKVNAFQPDTGRSIGSDEMLKWTFSTDMVTATKTGSWSKTGPATIEPAIPGSFCWRTPNELWFRPSELWQECTAYRVQIEDELKSIEGRPIASPRGFKFHTAPLECKEWQLVELNASREATVRISFNAPVSLMDVPGHISIADPDGTPLPHP